MFAGIGRPLLGSGSTSKVYTVSSKLARQVRLASVQKPFTNNSPERKKKEKPTRDIVPGAFLPLPSSQIEAFGGASETALKELPQPQKGAYSSKLLGNAVRLPNGHETLAKHFGLPRNIFVDFRLLSEPCAVSRRVTQSLAGRLDAAAKRSSQNERIVLTGSPGCGKSYALLQAVNHCYQNDWVVLYIPRAHKLVDSSTAYFYDAQSQTYFQPAASYQTLSQLWAVNRRLLEGMKLTAEVTFERRKPIPAGEPFKVLIDVAAAEQHLSPRILTAALEELGKQNRYPCLLAIDEFQALYSKTEYRNQHYEHIKSYHLLLPRLLMEYASGKRRFNRGAVVGALAPSLTHFPVSHELQQALGLGGSASPYAKLVPGMLDYANGLEAMPVPESLEYSEAASLFEMWVKDRALHTRVTDELFLSKLSESSGNARAFVHGGILATQIS